jgi:hypothetical protein
MAVHFKPYETATEYGTHYRFDEAGEGIPMHSHVNMSMWHSTRCIAGRCEIYGDIPAAILTAGETYKFKSYRLHELVALEPGTEIINVFTHGKPMDYIGVPADALSGTIAPVLLGKSMLLCGSAQSVQEE